MKVALVHEMLVKMGGAERVLKSLEDMFPDAPIFTLLYDYTKCGKAFKKEKVVTSPLQKWIRWKVSRQVLVSSMPTAIESFDFSGFDLVISSSSAFAHGIITPVETKHLCYCHAPMRYAWDYTHQYIAEKSEGIFSGAKRLFLKNIIHTLRMWDSISADRPDHILANSHTTAKRIAKFWKRSSEVVFPPVDTSRFEVSSTHQGYFLVVSALTRFKQIDIAVEALSHLPQHRLVIIGDGAERAKLQSLAGRNVEFLGRKSDADTAQFFQNCRAVIFPGLEDFGIVPVEAMASGKPVIAYGKGGVTETVIAEKTGVFFDELSSQSLQDGLTRFFKLEQQGSFDPHVCRARAEEFSEEIFRHKIREAVQTMCG